MCVILYYERLKECQASPTELLQPLGCPSVVAAPGKAGGWHLRPFLGTGGGFPEQSEMEIDKRCFVLFSSSFYFSPHNYLFHIYLEHVLKKNTQKKP